MNKLYLIPVEIVPMGSGEARGPKYFTWRYDHDPSALINSAWSNVQIGDDVNMVVVPPEGGSGGLE